MYHDRYERRGIRIYRRALQEAAMNIPFDNLTEQLYQATVNANVTDQEIANAYSVYYVLISGIHGRRVGRGINKEIKRFEVDFFDRTWAEQVRNWLIEQNYITRIRSVRIELVNYLIRYIGERLELGQTLAQITTELQRHILSRGFYRWQIERIVRTETTAAANLGASIAGDQSGILMVKEWVSSSDARTRRHEKGDVYDHLDMDQVRVNKQEPFTVMSRDARYPHDNIMFPGDPKGQPANVINCRCTVGLVPQRDLNGDLIFT